MNQIGRWISVIAVLGLAGGLTALAGPEKGSVEERKAQLLERHPEADTDGDGTLSDEEAQAFIGARHGGKAGFKGGPGPHRRGGKGFGNPEELLKEHPEADTDGDGKLSPEEHRALMSARRAGFVQDLLVAHPELDTDKDGQLSKEERRAGRETIEAFLKSRMSEKILAQNPEADADSDGVLSAEEMLAFRQGAGRGKGPKAGGPVQWLLDNFDKVDTNGDGMLSRAELEAAKESWAQMKPGDGSGKSDRQFKGKGRGGKGPGPRDGEGRKGGKESTPE